MEYPQSSQEVICSLLNCALAAIVKINNEPTKIVLVNDFIVYKI